MNSNKLNLCEWSFLENPGIEYLNSILEPETREGLFVYLSPHYEQIMYHLACLEIVEDSLKMVWSGDVNSPKFKRVCLQFYLRLLDGNQADLQHLEEIQ